MKTYKCVYCGAVIDPTTGMATAEMTRDEYVGTLIVPCPECGKQNRFKLRKEDVADTEK